MLFQLDIKLTEEDYLAFNCFHALESSYGKKQRRRNRIFFAVAMVIVIVSNICAEGWTTFSAIYAILLGLFTVLYMLLFKKISKLNIKVQLKRLKKMGKLPFDPESKLEFYEDKLVEISASKRIEQGYDAIEQIYIVRDRFVLMYQSSVAVYVLPLPQLKEQLEQEDFLRFLSQKCSIVEYC